MKNPLLALLFCLSAFFATHAQSVLAEWEGIYEGEMIVGSTHRPSYSVEVTFELIPLEADSTWTYRMTYGNENDGTVVKDYQLTRVGDSKVNFLLDEKDGIIIEMTLLNDCFYSMFEGFGSFYSISFRKSGESLLFDRFSSYKEDGTVTKNEDDNPDNVFEVTSYKPGLHQTITFTRTSTN